jgi:hypothetical protein
VTGEDMLDSARGNIPDLQLITSFC